MRSIRIQTLVYRQHQTSFRFDAAANTRFFSLVARFTVQAHRIQSVASSVLSCHFKA